MKFIYYNNSLGKLSETFSTSLLRGLHDQLGHELIAVCNSMTNAEQFAGIDVRIASHINKALRRAIFHRMVHRAMPNPLVKRLFFDFITAQTSKAILSTIVQLRPDAVYIEFGSNAVAIYQALEHLRIPYIVQFHGCDITRDLAAPHYARHMQKVFHSAYKLLCVSDHQRRLLILAGAPEQKVQLVRLDIDTQKLQPIPWEQRQQYGQHACFVGRFVEKKHPIATIEAFRIVVSKMPKARLVMVGEGPMLNEARRRIQNYGLQENVILTGALPHEQAMETLRKSMISVQHSTISSDGDQEGFPVSLGEAAALELPIVSTLHSGIPENVIDGKTGFTVREFDYETMAERIIYLLNHPDQAQSMGQAGRLHIQAICQPQERYNTIATLLREAAASENSR
jgi:glycosyltransferase involved in cell wall biosynthesis